MQSGAQFAEILAEKVGRFEATGRPAAGSRAPHAKPHPPVVLFFHHGAGAPVMDNRVARAYGAGFRPRAAAAPAPEPPRPARILTDREQRALAHFVAMGAKLRSDFTNQDLRSAFRLLARLYHPDRHPGCSEFEKARLSRLFAGLHDAYRTLLASIPLPPAA
jgi:hypothetical protein